jgi:replicative DNA helicase
VTVISVLEQLERNHPADDAPVAQTFDPGPGALRGKPSCSPWKEGDAFVLDDPADLDPLWGTSDQPVWASGEGLLIVAPTAIGKTTLAQKLLKARLGAVSEVLGWPVKPAGKPILYLAMDRPRQIRRASRRIFGEEHRGLLRERLIVREGPLPLDLGRAPEILVETVEDAGAGSVFIDSLKDAAVKLTDDEAGGNINRAFQFCNAAGIDVTVLHHQRKGQGGARPKTLEDVYGSSMITNGAGSVILLWGAAGDCIVELTHLKPPADPVGPLKIEFNHDLGEVSIYRGNLDPLTVLRQRPKGLTSMDLARLQFECEKPNDNQRKRAQRALDRLVGQGHARKTEYVPGGAGGVTAVAYFATDSIREVMP